MKKHILFIYNKDFMQAHSRHIHSYWAIDCQTDYDIKMWGNGFVPDDELTLKHLRRVVDSFRPDFIYMTGRKKYTHKEKNKIGHETKDWLPDLTSIKVPKIFVEIDTFRYDPKAPWYKQFDKLYCRDNTYSSIGDWSKIPVLKWSVSEMAFPKNNLSRKGIFFVGTIDHKPYKHRRKMRDLLCKKINFTTIVTDVYWDVLHKASALICPSEGRTHSGLELYIPAKLFEYLASGAAVVTNCDLCLYSPDLEPFVIKYTDLKNLESKLDMDFTTYHNRALDAMRNHTHKVRYKELFG